MNIQTTVNIQSCTYTCAVSCFIKKLYQFKCCGHLYFYFVFPPLGSKVVQAVSVLWLSPLKPCLVIVSCERVFVVDFSCASRVFLRVLGFSSLNTIRLYKLEGFLRSRSLSKGLHVLLLVSC